MITFSNKARASSGGAIPYDVSASYTLKNGKSRQKRMRFSFSPKAATMIVGQGEFIVVGTDDKKPDRIYFAKANSLTGYKLSAVGRSDRRAFSPNTVKNITPTAFIGYYNLRYDKDAQLFYIDKNFKITV